MKFEILRMEHETFSKVWFWRTEQKEKISQIDALRTHSISIDAYNCKFKSELYKELKHLSTEDRKRWQKLLCRQNVRTYDVLEAIYEFGCILPEKYRDSWSTNVWGQDIIKINNEYYFCDGDSADWIKITDPAILSGEILSLEENIK